MSSFEDMLKASPAWFAISMIVAGVMGGIAGTKWLDGKIDTKVSEALTVAKVSGDFKGERGTDGQRGERGQLGEKGARGEKGEKGERGEPGKSGENAGFTSGVVVASWKKCESLGEGWSDFHEAGGRMIVGAGNPVNDPFRKGLTRRESWTPRMQDPTEATVGGAEAVKLTAMQMPQHYHEYKDIFFSERRDRHNDFNYHMGHKDFAKIPMNIGQNVSKGVDKDNSGFQFTRKTLSGNVVSEPTPNMPPYIALYFCKKD